MHYADQRCCDKISYSCTAASNRCCSVRVCEGIKLPLRRAKARLLAAKHQQPTTTHRRTPTTTHK